MNYRIVLWDFDGTLVDTSEGILGSLEVAFQQMGMKIPPQSVLNRFIGPPLMYSFMNFIGMTQEQAEHATRLYRADYEATGIYRSQIYAGLPDILCRLRAQGKQIGVATLKPERMANLLLRHFGIEELIDVCSGSLSDEIGSASKAQIIEKALLGMQNVNKAEVVMIGDTIYDAHGAQETGVDFIAAQYGIGMSSEELASVSYVCAAERTEDIGRFLLSDSL